MNKRGVIHFSAAPDISLISTSNLVDTNFFCCCGDFGACGDDCGGGCAVGGRGDVRDNDAFSEIGDGAALKVRWGW